MGKDSVSLEEIYQVTNASKKNIIDQFQLMDLWINWDCFEYTMDEDHVKLVQETFVKLYRDGLVKKNHRIVSFDTYFGTAVSDLEVEHYNRKGKIYEITYTLGNNKVIKVATTRPETIFADVALAVNPKDKRYIDLIGKRAMVPLVGRSIPIIADDAVDPDFGTGVLKITPAHAPVDYEIAQRHALPMISMIGRNGLSIVPGTDYDGMTMKALREKVVKELQAPSEDLEQSIPYSSRSKTQIEYITEQHWFLDMKSLANKALKKHPKFLPGHWKKTYDHWLKNITPWCLSRTIQWGQWIPAYSNDAGEIYVGFEPPEGYKPEKMVFDTWFSSALWPALFKKKYGFSFNMVVTGFDILFFWIARMIMMEEYCSGELPFKEVFIHGLICDEKGEKMSKTRGNVLDPRVLIDKYGNKLVRLSLLWAFTRDRKIKFSERIMQQLSRVLDKLKNLENFLRTREIEGSVTQKGPMGKLLEATYNCMRSYICNYKTQIENRDLQKQVRIARDFLYFVCDWVVELAKVDKTFLPALNYGFSQVNSMFFPILGGDRIYPLDQAAYRVDSDRTLREFQQQVEMLRFFHKLDKNTWVEDELLSKLCRLRRSPEAIYQVKMGSMVISLGKQPADLAKDRLPKLKEELEKIQAIPLDRLHSQKSQELQVKISSLREKISWLTSFKQTTY